MAWATDAETLALTGVTVPPPVLAQAQGVVELFAGISEDSTADLTAANRRMLRAACAYQAAWMVGQVDVTTRTDVAQLTQDGTQITPAGPDALILAPLARRALDRLSWLRKRTLRTVRSGRPTYATPAAYQDAWLRDEDGRGGWRAL